MAALASLASDWNADNPPWWLLIGAPAAAGLLLAGLALAAPVAAPPQGRHAAGARPAPGMSVPEPLDRDYVEEVTR